MARRVGTESPWVNGGRGSERAPLAADVEADVCVIGAGIAGLSTAYMLQRDGASVVVLDDGPVGGGQTGRTTAHLSNALDDRYTELERLHGAEGARYAAASHTAAIARIEEIVREEGLECDFARVDGFLFAPEASAMRPATTPPPTTLPDLLRDELAAARRAGVPGVEQAVRAPLVSFDTGPCLRFPGQGRFEPIRYLDGLAAAFERRGGRLFTGTHATTVTGGAAALVGTAPGHRVSCGAIVVATNTPVNDRFVIHTKQAPYLTYVIAARVPHGSVPDVLLWDTADPYHYVRLQPAAGDGDARQDLLIVGGEDHKTGQASDGERRFASLEGWTRERFPMVEGVVRRWAGQVMEPSDGAAFIGRNPSDADNVYVATGDSGHGMTHGTIAGMLLADLIAGRPNPWAALYDPARISLASASDLLVENLNVAAQYVEWLRPGDASSEAEIANGAGAVLRRGLAKVAVYRDDEGRLHRSSATCPHLGCIVSWNAAERTWDCPCHGSRFSCTGRVLNGPANQDLTALDGAAGEQEGAHGEQEQV